MARDHEDGKASTGAFGAVAVSGGAFGLGGLGIGVLIPDSEVGREILRALLGLLQQIEPNVLMLELFFAVVLWGCWRSNEKLRCNFKIIYPKFDSILAALNLMREDRRIDRGIMFVILERAGVDRRKDREPRPPRDTGERRVQGA